MLTLDKCGDGAQIKGMEGFGAWMERWRLLVGYTSRRFFSRKAGVSETLVYELEAGRGKPFHERRDVIRRAIAGELHLPLEALDAYSRGVTGPPEIVTPITTLPPPRQSIADLIRQVGGGDMLATHAQAISDIAQTMRVSVGEIVARLLRPTEQRPFPFEDIEVTGDSPRTSTPQSPRGRSSARDPGRRQQEKSK